MGLYTNSVFCFDFVLKMCLILFTLFCPVVVWKLTHFHIFVYSMAICMTTFSNMAPCFQILSVIVAGKVFEMITHHAALFKINVSWSHCHAQRLYTCLKNVYSNVNFITFFVVFWKILPPACIRFVVLLLLLFKIVPFFSFSRLL